MKTQKFVLFASVLSLTALTVLVSQVWFPTEYEWRVPSGTSATPSTAAEPVEDGANLRSPETEVGGSAPRRESRSGPISDAGPQTDSGQLLTDPDDQPAGDSTDVPREPVSPAETDEAPGNGTPGPPAGQLSISGRVLNVDGDPLPGMAISVRPAAGPRSPVASARSDDTGAYEINELTAGDYRLTTVATDVYPSMTAVFPAGLRSADIVLAAGYPAKVFGTITDATGAPLSGVEVVLNSSDSVTHSDDSGRYELSFEGRGNDRYAAKYSLTGYSTKTSVLPAEDFKSGGSRLDVQLARLDENSASVTGAVQSEYGEPVQGARINLASPTLGTRYSGTSDAQGNFYIGEVSPGTDYQLSVRTNELYEPYWRDSLDIAANGYPLQIMLKPLAGRTVWGNMVDAYGNPVPDYTLMVRSSRTSSWSALVTGDALGSFSIEDVPEGTLSFSSRSQPFLTINGVAADTSQDVSVNLVLDWGNQQVSGRVLDEAGNPVAGAQVAMAWALEQGGGQRSSSRRTAISDVRGVFHFSELGPGAHTVQVRAPGYESVGVEYEVGSDYGDIIVRLGPT